MLIHYQGTLSLPVAGLSAALVVASMGLSAGGTLYHGQTFPLASMSLSAQALGRGVGLPVAALLLSAPSDGLIALVGSSGDTSDITSIAGIIDFL